MSSRALFKGSFILLAGTAVVSVCNFLFTSVISARLLGPPLYGIFASLMSLIVILTVPAGTITLVSAKFTSSLKALGNLAKINYLWQYLTIRLAILAGGLFLIFLLLGNPISNFLNPTGAEVKVSPTHIIVLALSFFMGFLLPINRGILQGLQKFTSFAVNSSLEAIIKVITSLFLITFFKIYGALIALILGMLAGYLLSFPPLREIFKTSPEITSVREIKGYSSQALLAFLLITIIANIDVILIKHFWDPTQAGLYAALQKMGNIVFFVSAPVSLAMFPMIAELYTLGKRHYHLFLNSLAVVTSLALIVIAIYYFSPLLAVKVIYGGKYLEISPYLVWFGLAILFYSLSYTFVNYFLSIKIKAFLIPLVLFTLLEIGLIWSYHSNFFSVIKILILVNFLTLLTLASIYLYLKKRQIKEFIKGIY